MHTRSTILSSRMLAAYALGACLAAPLAMAASSTATMSAADIEARYKTDIARCNAGQTNQDKPTCIREAGAAREEANRNRLNNGNPQAYDKNEKARCDALPMDQRDECMLQMSGVGTTTQGSVGGGGVLRETTITTTETPAPAPGTVPGTAPAPGLTPSPPAVVPAPSLTPVPPGTVPGTGPK